MTDLRKLAEQATPGPWEPGHLADDSHPCNCKGIFDGSYAGGLFHAVVDNELPISEGGNDGPPLEEAKANLRYIAAAHPQAVTALLDRIDALEAEIVLFKDAEELSRAEIEHRDKEIIRLKKALNMHPAEAAAALKDSSDD